MNTFSRFFVGGVFIFSGLIKLNDPIGTQIKMEEYFEVFASDIGSFFHIFGPWALEIGMFIIILEIVLGVATLLYYQMRITTWALMGLVLFFAFLTFYSAYFNKVTDCGCFGDAIKLTPWQSFYKDIILLVFVAHLFWYRKNYVSPLSLHTGGFWVGCSLLVSLFLGSYAIGHLPFIDFRAYRVGNVIPEQMIPKESPIIEYTFGKGEEVVTSMDFLSQEEGYTYLSSKIVNEDKIKPKITDYNVTDRDGNSMTQYTFQGVKFIVVIHDAQTAATEKSDELRRLTEQLSGKADCLILTSSGVEKIEAFRHENQLGLPYYYADATVLKTIVRSNPGITLWKDGLVLGKWHYNDTPTIETITSLL